MTVGKISAWSRPTRSAVSVSRALASANRRVSAGSRTNARITRRPDSCSRSTPFTSSSRSCILRNWGSIRAITRPTETARTGTQTATSQDRPTSSRSAITTPTTQVIGAATTMAQLSTTSDCTCCTSFVVRLISDGAPKRASSRAENVPTRANTAARRSRPAAMATRAP
jgi:hypothetical protein